MSEAARDPLAELARLLPTVLDESAPHELAARLRSLLPTGEPAPRSLWCLARGTLREVAGIAIGSYAERAQLVGFAGFGGNGPRCRGGV